MNKKKISRDFHNLFSSKQSNKNNFIQIKEIHMNLINNLKIKYSKNYKRKRLKIINWQKY